MSIPPFKDRLFAMIAQSGADLAEVARETGERSEVIERLLKGELAFAVGEEARFTKALRNIAARRGQQLDPAAAAKPRTATKPDRPPPRQPTPARRRPGVLPLPGGPGGGPSFVVQYRSSNCFIGGSEIRHRLIPIVSRQMPGLVMGIDFDNPAGVTACPDALSGAAKAFAVYAPSDQADGLAGSLLYSVVGRPVPKSIPFVIAVGPDNIYQVLRHDAASGLSSPDHELFPVLGISF